MLTWSSSWIHLTNLLGESSQIIFRKALPDAVIYLAEIDQEIVGFAGVIDHVHRRNLCKKGIPTTKNRYATNEKNKRNQ